MIADLAEISHSEMSSEAKSLCSSMLDRSTNFRPSARQCLTHPWFTTNSRRAPWNNTKNIDSADLLHRWSDLADFDFRLRGAIRAIAWELQFPIPAILGECTSFDQLPSLGGIAAETVQAVRQMLDPGDQEGDDELPAVAIQLILQTSLAIKLSEVDEVLADAFAAFSPAEGEDFVAELPSASIMQALEVGEDSSAADLEAARTAVLRCLEESPEKTTRFEEVRAELVRYEADQLRSDLSGAVAG